MKTLGRATRFAVACVAAGLGGAAVLEVDGNGGTPYPTIQSGIDAATPGVDEVLVRCGTYLENVTMRDGVSVRGERPDCTIIDGGDLGPTVLMPFLGPDTELAGFTIRGGRSLSGGGIRVDGGRPVITRNVIRDNGTPVFGDGFYDYGGGIYVSSAGVDPDTAPTISFNIVRDNSAFTGGGIVLADVSGAVITTNLIAGNEGSFGGGMYSVLADASIVNNSFIDNRGDYGGGLAAADIAGTLANNVFYLNYGEDFWTPTSNDVTYAANLSYANPPTFYGSFLPPESTIHAPPQFLDLDAGDFSGFQPRSTSPLIDAGDPSVPVPSEDLRGIPRPLDGDQDTIPVVDIGARENEGLTDLLHDGTQFVWDPAPGPETVYNVYRGDLKLLLDEQIYTQDPSSVPGARHFCGTAIGLADDERPSPGKGFFYLVTALGPVEGTLGFDSALQQRPNTLGCVE